jgi:hypothetical protein
MESIHNLAPVFLKKTRHVYILVWLLKLGITFDVGG